MMGRSISMIKKTNQNCNVRNFRNHNWSQLNL